MVDVTGWVGGGMAAAAYMLVSGGRIAPGSVVFQGLNIVGAVLLAIVAFSHGALPVAVTNIAWIMFGLQALAGENLRPWWHRRMAVNAGPAPVELAVVGVDGAVSGTGRHALCDTGDAA